MNTEIIKILVILGKVVPQLCLFPGTCHGDVVSIYHAIGMAVINGILIVRPDVHVLKFTFEIMFQHIDINGTVNINDKIAGRDLSHGVSHRGDGLVQPADLFGDRLEADYDALVELSLAGVP